MKLDSLFSLTFTKAMSRTFALSPGLSKFVTVHSEGVPQGGHQL